MRARTTTARTAVALVCAALALTACSDDGGGDDAAPAVTTSTTDSVAPDPTDTSTATTEPDDETDDGADGDRCLTSDVRAAVRDLDSVPGSRYAEIVLVNVSDEACTVEGFGGMQLLDESREPVPTRLVRLTRPAARPVVLDPGAAATSEIRFSVVATDADRPKGSCQPRPTHALITPPDQEDSLRIRWNLGPVCDEGRIEQQSYQPGQA